jgi:hypothetical protein
VADVTIDVTSHVARGRAALGEGRWTDAADLFDAALELGGDPDAAFGLAIARRIVTMACFGEVEIESLTRPMVMGSDVEDDVQLVAATPQSRGLFDGQPDERIHAAIEGLRAAFTPLARPEGVVMSCSMAADRARLIRRAGQRRQRTTLAPCVEPTATLAGNWAMMLTSIPRRQRRAVRRGGRPGAGPCL